MRKKALIVVALLLAVSITMAAMAYTSAQVVNPSSLKIVNTNNALLSLAPLGGIGNKDATVKVVNGELVFQFGMGVGRDGTTETFYGLQPNSTYVWEDLVDFRNKSADTIDVTVRVTGDLAPYVTLGEAGGPGCDNHAPVWGTKGQSLTFHGITKESGSGMQNCQILAVKIEIPENTTIQNVSGTIVFDAVAK